MNLLVVLGAVEHLGEDAAKAPHVDCLVVILLDQDNFGRPIPSADYVATQTSFGVAALSLLLSLDSSDCCLRVDRGCGGEDNLLVEALRCLEVAVASLRHHWRPLAQTQTWQSFDHFWAGNRCLNWAILINIKFDFRQNQTLCGNGSWKAKIAQFYLALSVDEYISRLDITMHDVCWVQEVEGAQSIVDNNEDMLVVKLDVAWTV